MKQLLVFLILLISIPLFAKNKTTLKGSVKAASGEGIAFATLMVNAALDSTLVKADITGENGEFIFSNFLPGSYFIQVSYVGYETYYGEYFQLDENEELVLPEIILLEKVEELEQVVVKATRPLVEIQPDKTVFNVDASINAAGSDGLELLRKAPGVVLDQNNRVMLQGRSGVKIYIDGRPSRLGPDDLVNYLRSMQADEIESIEIITNPSAKYEAEGNAGIINIRLKKDKSLGSNGSFNSSYRMGTYSKVNNAMNGNYRDKRINVFARYSYNDAIYSNYNYIYREQVGLAFDGQANMRNDYHGHNFRLGSDLFLSERSTLGFLFHGYNNDGSFNNISNILIFPKGQSQVDNMLYATNDIAMKRNNLNFNTNYAYDNRQGTTLNLDADIGRFRNDGSSYQPNYYKSGDGETIMEERIFASNTPTTIDIYTFKADLEKSLGKGKLGVGGKFAYVSTDNTYDFFNVVDDVHQVDRNRSNQFDYLENVNAVYATYQQQWKKWNLMVGLRMEHTHSDGKLTSLKQVGLDRSKQDYVNVFPSGGVTWQMNDHHAFRLNVSRRVDRPSYQDLNPFEFKLDELTFQKGNAFLRPQYTNSISLTHTLNQKVNTTFTYTVTNDLITRITDTLDVSATFITFVNLDKQKTASLGVSYPFSINKWWSVYSNMTAFHTENKAYFEPGKTIDISTNAVNIYAQNTFMLPKGYKLELSGYYNSPTVWGGNFEADAMYAIDLGVQKKLLNERATLKVGVSDIFNTAKFVGANHFGALLLRVESGWESRQFKVNFNYLFGNQQVKAARRRSTGMEDEQRRIKTDG